MCRTIRRLTGIVMVSTEPTALFGGKYMDCTGFKEDVHYAIQILQSSVRILK